MACSYGLAQAGLVSLSPLTWHVDLKGSKFGTTQWQRHPFNLQGKGIQQSETILWS